MPLKFLNSKKIKEIKKILSEQFDFNDKLDYVFLMNEKNRIFIINNDVKEIDLDKIRINTLGLKFGERMNDGIRLSIEGAQMIGPKAYKNIIELDDKQAKQWLKGEDVDIDKQGNEFVILKYKDDFLGCGKLKQNTILNFVPKTRRISIS